MRELKIDGNPLSDMPWDERPKGCRDVMSPILFEDSARQCPKIGDDSISIYFTIRNSIV